MLSKDRADPAQAIDWTSTHHLTRNRSAQLIASPREVLRIAWNERQEGLGLERKRPRPDDVAPAKFLRESLRNLHQEARRELGFSPDLHPELED